MVASIDTAQQVKELRERTGLGLMACKSALQEAAGDLEEAEKVLRKRGMAATAKREANERPKVDAEIKILPGRSFSISPFKAWV